MIVDDADCLRTWLASVLKPLCDADPAALAKYVLALIKKDKTDEELKQSMIDQLDVFLQNETKGFVDILFKVLVTKEYLPATESISSEGSMASMSSISAASIASKTSTGSDGSRMDGSTTSASTLSSGISLTMDANGSGLLSASMMEENASVTGPANEDRSAPMIRRDNIKKEEDKDRDRARRNKSRSPRRSNSKSRERGRRSRSPRDYRPRHRGRKSPIRRYDRQERDIWDRRRSPPARNRSASPRTRSRTPPRYRRPYNSRSKSRSRSPNMIRSPLKETKDSVQVPAPARFEGRIQEPEDIKPTISSVMRPPAPKVPEGYTTALTAPTICVTGNRCRDFDERGLCMRGELCPFDHGCNPVVLEDVGGQSALKQRLPGDTTTLGNETSEYRIADPIMYPTGMIRPPRPVPCPEGMEPPHGWGPGPAYRPRHNVRGRGGLIRHGYMGPQRELISVPVVGSSQPMMMEEFPPMPMQPTMGHRGTHMRGMHMGRGRGGGRGSFDHGRLGSKAYRNNQNCSLEVKRIPREQNNIMDLNSHFWRFGKIVNIQINFEGDPEAALITFSSPVEAYTAYRSTEAVLNNRFVKVFWHNKEKENEDGETFQGPLSVRDRLGTSEPHVEPMEEDKILMSGNSLTKTVYNHNATKKELAQEKVEAVEAIKRSQEMLAAQESLKREQAEKKKEAMLMRSNLQKRKQDVLAEQIEQQKKLIQKIESGKGIMKPEEIDQLMGIVKSLQESIESIKSDLDKSSNSIHPGQKTQNPQVAPVSKNKDETQKEILDAELDLYNKELEGGDTLALKRKVLELRSQAQAAGLLRGRGSYRGLLRSFTNRGRGAMRSLRRVDRRPTKICITGHPLSKSSEMLAHFAQYGLIENYETDTVTPSLSIKYESRKSAEVAMAQGRIVQHIPLDIQWVANAVVEKIDQKGSSSTNGESSQQDDMDNPGSMDDEEELGDLYVDQLDLYDQYEEEDEDEDERTWRR